MENNDLLKHFFNQEKDSFSEEQMPEGHIERFHNKMKSQIKKRKIIYTSLISSAALIALFLILNNKLIDKHSQEISQHQENKVELLELTSIEQIKKEAAQILSKIDLDEYNSQEIQASLESLTIDAILMNEQLPDELSEDEKIRIITTYYNAKLDGIKQFKKLIASNPEERNLYLDNN